MSQHIYAVLPYDSGIGFDPDKETNCVWDYHVYELKGIEAELSYSGLTDAVALYKDFIVFNTCLRVSEFCQNSKTGYSSLRKDFYLIAQRLGLKEVWYVPEYYTDYMDEIGFTYCPLPDITPIIIDTPDFISRIVIQSTIVNYLTVVQRKNYNDKVERQISIL